MGVLRDLREGRPGRHHRDRVLWQAAATLLSYPDDVLLARLPLVRAAAVPARAREVLGALADAIEGVDLLAAQARYVETFDHKRRRTMYLTYWVAGDTRNRGQAILRFAQTYRAAGVEPPTGELPDHLTVALEFAALVDPAAGYELLAAHRTPVAMLEAALREAGSVYADTVALVLGTLPAAGADDLAEARRLTVAGPPVEAVGLDVYPMPVPGGPR